MIKIKIEDDEMFVPTDCSEIKLSSYIEFNDHHKRFAEFYDSGKKIDAAKEAVMALSCVINGFTQEVAEKLTIGSYNKADQAKTINELMYLVNSTITTYEIPDLTEQGYKFWYKDAQYHVPMAKSYDGTINPNLTYGQYIEVSETVRVQNQGTEKTPSEEYAEFLRILAAVVREVDYAKEETPLSLRKMTDANMLHFQEIDMKTGLDVYFFLNGTINI